MYLNETEQAASYWVTYQGKNRRHIFGDDAWPVVAENATSVCLDAGPTVGNQWVNKHHVTRIDRYAEVSNVQAFDALMNPHALSLEIVDNEIKRLEKRLTELRAAKQVLESL